MVFQDVLSLQAVFTYRERKLRLTMTNTSTGGLSSFPPEKSMVGVRSFSLILSLCIIRFIHSNVQANGGDFCCNPSFWKVRLGLYHSDHDSLDIIAIKSTLRLLSGGGDGDSSYNVNDSDMNDNNKNDNLCSHELQGDENVHRDMDSIGEPMGRNQEVSSSQGDTVDTKDKVHYLPEEESILEAQYNDTTEESNSNLESYSYASNVNEEETVIDVGDALNDSSIRPLSISPDDEIFLDDDNGLGDSFESEQKVQLSNARNFEMMEDMEEEWFFHDQVMDIVDTEYYDDDNNERKVENDKEATQDQSFASHQRNKTIGDNTDEMVNHFVQDTAQPIILDVQPDVMRGNNHAISTGEGEDSQDDELRLRQSSTISCELRSTLENLSYKSYEIDVMKPTIAAAIAQLKLRRPVHGIPEIWSNTPLPSNYFISKIQENDESDMSTIKEKEKFRCLAHKVFKRVLLPSVGIIFAVSSFSVSQSRSRSTTKLKRAKRKVVETCETPMNITSIDGIIIDDEGNVLLRTNALEGLQQETETSSPDLQERKEAVAHRNHWFEKLVKDRWLGKFISNVTNQTGENIRS